MPLVLTTKYTWTLIPITMFIFRDNKRLQDILPARKRVSSQRLLSPAQFRSEKENRYNSAWKWLESIVLVSHNNAKRRHSWNNSSSKVYQFQNTFRSDTIAIIVHLIGYYLCIATLLSSCSFDGNLRASVGPLWKQVKFKRVLCLILY